MRILISGASGFLGQKLTRALQQSGQQVSALVRREPHGEELRWDPQLPLDPAKLSGYDAVVHLAGKNIAGRWTEKFKSELLASRVQGTRTLATAAAESYRRSEQPKAFISASGIGYYGHRGDELLTEKSAAGTGFLAELSRQWEAASVPASEAGVRVVCLRIGVVLDRHGGALKQLLLPFRLGLGGRIGTGKQYWSWVSLEDVVGVVLLALRDESLRGPLNVVAPSPARNAEFVHALGSVLHRPTMFPFPEFAVRALLGEMGQELLLTSARVIPKKLQDHGYNFAHRDVENALRAALR
ncbi:MAG TPA: TIGR01777 family oxidoreductase [Terriglobales bacterium]|nr:TIGR01777 family oxidoreductase [Terriglobales bacterium]